MQTLKYGADDQDVLAWRNKVTLNKNVSERREPVSVDAKRKKSIEMYGKEEEKCNEFY